MFPKPHRVRTTASVQLSALVKVSLEKQPCQDGRMKGAGLREVGKVNGRLQEYNLEESQRGRAVSVSG